MTEKEIKLVRLGFNQAIKCMENHPENSEFDTIYFERAIEEAENLILFGVGKSFNATFKKGDKVKYKTYKNAVVTEDLGGDTVCVKLDMKYNILANRNLLELKTKSV